MPARRLFALCALLVAAGTAAPVFSATIVIVNRDTPGVGFNDPAAAAPVGGNFGTTLGQQRLNVFAAAANVWGAKLASPITIRVEANFGPLTPCTANSGVLGSAGPTGWNANFSNAPRNVVWYPVALANALAGIDHQPNGEAISASFNGNIGTPGCLPGYSWYLGLDNGHGSQIDLFTVLLHELGHGLGLIGLVSLSSGSTLFGIPDIYSVFTRDNSVLLNWNVMSDSQRLTSSTNTGNVVFDGPETTTAAATILTAGKDAFHHPKLYVPNPSEEGSSVYHFDVSASPNQLMEPTITSDLTHSVDAPNDLTTSALYDLGWPRAVPLTAPTNLVATATSATTVNVTWSSVPSATSYNVYRSINGITYGQVATGIMSTSHNDSAAAATSYLYRVRAVSDVTESDDSNTDLATTVMFTDPSLVAGATEMKAAHISELRTAVTAVRTLAASGPFSYTDPTITAGTTEVKAAHITELRTALSAARSTLALIAVTYADPTVTAGSTPPRALHVSELRAGVQ